MLFIVNMIGLGFGPTLLGMLADGLSNWRLGDLIAIGKDFNSACLPLFADNRLWQPARLDRASPPPIRSWRPPAALPVMVGCVGA
jgi:hypothetical protein